MFRGDSDWADDVDTRFSVSGGLLSLCIVVIRSRVALFRWAMGRITTNCTCQFSLSATNVLKTLSASRYQNDGIYIDDLAGYGAHIVGCELLYLRRLMEVSTLHLEKKQCPRFVPRPNKRNSLCWGVCRRITFAVGVLRRAAHLRIRSLWLSFSCFFFLVGALSFFVSRCLLPGIATSLKDTFLKSFTIRCLTL